MYKYPENQRFKVALKFLLEQEKVKNKSDFAKSIGIPVQLIYDTISEKLKLSSEILEKSELVFGISKIWMQFGEGDMLKSLDNLVEEPKSEYKIINNENRGVPYFDVDFIGGYDLIENDQTIVPAYFIDFPEYNNADEWINITGRSMDPLISHGDKIAVRELRDWDTYLLYGEVYALVTEQYRTVKIVRKSKLGDDYIRLVPINSEFDEQDIPKSIIRHVFNVLGTAKKLF